MQAHHPSQMHLSGASANLSTGHFLPSPGELIGFWNEIEFSNEFFPLSSLVVAALASPVGSTGATQPPSQPISANASCSTLFVANLGQFVSEHELKEIFAR